MYDGELGVLPGRAPLIGRLGYGELRIRAATETRRFFVDGGFAQVRANTVTVLTGRALKAEEINVPAAEEALHASAAAGITAEAQRMKQERARRSSRGAWRIGGRQYGTLKFRLAATRSGALRRKRSTARRG